MKKEKVCSNCKWWEETEFGFGLCKKLINSDFVMIASNFNNPLRMETAKEFGCNQFELSE